MPNKKGTTPKTQVIEKAPRKLKKLSGGFAKFEKEGDVAEGQYQGMYFVNIRQGAEMVAVPKYAFLQDDGDLVECLGTTQIAETMERVSVGTYCQIVYIGKQKTRTGFQVKTFDISVDEQAVLLALSTPRNQVHLPTFDPETGEIFDEEPEPEDEEPEPEDELPF